MGRVKELLTPEGPLPRDDYEPDFDELWGEAPLAERDVTELQVQMILSRIREVNETLDQLLYRDAIYHEPIKRGSIEKVRKSLDDLVRYFY